MPRKFSSFSVQEIIEILQAVRDSKDRKVVAKDYDVSASTIGTFVKNFGHMDEKEITEEVGKWNKYKKILSRGFFEKLDEHGEESVELPFSTFDLARWKTELKIVGGNPYDLKYNSKGRGSLPDEIQDKAPNGQEWRIKSIAKGQYVFKLYAKGDGILELDFSQDPIKIPDALPAIVERYARDDEQSLLARIRYNNLVSVFLGISTYSLQSHWKTSAKSAGGSPVEVDEMYVGIDGNGVHYVIPVEAKGRHKSEKLTADQIFTNYMAAKHTFPDCHIIPVAAKVVDNFTFAMIRFEVSKTEEVKKNLERHYTLAINQPVGGPPRPMLSDDDIRAVRAKAVNSQASAPEIVESEDGRDLADVASELGLEKPI
ncbi:hypothetical protein [Methylobacterium fujisawaense]|uniref:hypothetical protein n=1 Tax=Methylobacterium fujisawaense TaxID=107400 RepID=UPI00244B3BF1|nr:hypothetical protein [Methylobacterium fujisawaense]MDH3032100.1 hypothetical protein [Methylobacterium fujisawaense]